MPSEVLVSSHFGLWRSGTLNAQRSVAQMDSCGVQQREITIRRKSGASVPPNVSGRFYFNHFTSVIISIPKENAESTFVVISLSVIIEEVSADRSGF